VAGTLHFYRGGRKVSWTLCSTIWCHSPVNECPVFSVLYKVKHGREYLVLL